MRFITETLTDQIMSKAADGMVDNRPVTGVFLNPAEKRQLREELIALDMCNIPNDIAGSKYLGVVIHDEALDFPAVCDDNR